MSVEPTTNPGGVDPADERPHLDAAMDEWVFAAWTPTAGVISGYRICRDDSGADLGAWYWAAVVQQGQPVLHLVETEIRLRPDPLLVKSPGLWAEHTCLDPLRQWSIGNEAFAVALADPADALERAYGTPTPMGCDLEWYATGAPEPLEHAQHGCDQHGFHQHGFHQHGVMYGRVEIIGMPDISFTEAPARRWRRWGAHAGPIALPRARAHAGLRAVFGFPDGSTLDLVLTPTGWHHRAVPTASGTVTGR